MPGASPSEAIDTFLDPLRLAASCLSHQAHIGLTPGARGDVGKTHAWTLNEADGLTLSGGWRFQAQMHFEVLDQGQSQRARRFRVTTRGYRYGLLKDGVEMIAAHWHPVGRSPYTAPHWHVGAAALSPTGVFLVRAHLESSRVSLEHMVRQALEIAPGLESPRSDWHTVLANTEESFQEHRSWGD